jgi:putative FmdB family regulatory protein
MPVYEFVCGECGAHAELLLRLGETGRRPCEACGGQMRQRFGRVAVKYGSWGFGATDKLVDRPGSSDFKALRERAERISDGGEP